MEQYIIEFVNAEFDSIIFESTLPSRIETPNLSADECEELELSLNSMFTSAMERIIEGLEQSKVELDRIATVDQSI
tara:strand:+ start:408 stop:635 length:228 start_codon:yes stop_codon:yes gene_type:complete